MPKKNSLINSAVLLRPHQEWGVTYGNGSLKCFNATVHKAFFLTFKP